MHATTWQSARRALEMRRVARTLSSLRQLWDRRSRLSTSEYTVSRDRVLLRNPADTTHSADSVLHLSRLSDGTALALLGIRKGVFGLPPVLSRTIRDSCLLHGRRWHELFCQPHAGIALHEMQETGLLAAAIPEWSTIDSLVDPRFLSPLHRRRTYARGSECRSTI